MGSKRHRTTRSVPTATAAMPDARFERNGCLDTEGLRRMEDSFREWVNESPVHRPARLRIFLIFLLIRYTGAKLNEVLRLNPYRDIDWDDHCVVFRAVDDREESSRAVDVSRHGLQQIRAVVEDPQSSTVLQGQLGLDAAFVRRKFYERAEACGFSRRLGGPEMIRKSRAVELLKGHIPLHVVQRVLGQAPSSAPPAYVAFTESDIRKVMKLFVERESVGQTSARNAFYGRVEAVLRGDIQAVVRLVTMGGYRITTVITTHSLQRLAIQEGKFMVAEVKSPWVILVLGSQEPAMSAENQFQGTIRHILRGQVTSEVTVELSDGTELCALLSSESASRMAIKEGDSVWAVFSAHAVVLHGNGSGPSPWS